MFSIVPLLFVAALAAAQELPNGSFEDGLTGWRELWTRDGNAGSANLDKQVYREGKQSVRIEHRGQHDWSLQPDWQPQIQSGEICELKAWIKVKGQGTATLGAVTYDKAGKVLDWAYGGRSIRGAADWQHVLSRFVVPADVTSIQPRLIGDGPATVWVDDFTFAQTGNVQQMRPSDLPDQVTIQNASLSVNLHTSDGTLTVLDKRNGHHWQQQPLANDMIVLNAKAERHIECTLLHTPSGLDVKAVIQLEDDLPELIVRLAAEGQLPGAVRFPHPFVAGPGSYLVVPMNEGISYPVDDSSIHPKRLVAYGGHGICMGFWGVTDGERGQMAILETPDDAALRIARSKEMLCGAVEWDSQRGQFGEPRRLRYVFFDRGGHVAMCKRYRRHSQDRGIFKSLQQKRLENPNVDRLIGAVNVWCWDRDALGVVRELQAAGIERILWSHRGSPEVLRAMNDMGILTSRYDIYQDVMNPENFKSLHGIHPDWTTPAWPKDLMIGANGDWTRGWRVKGKDGGWYPCGVLCDKQAPEYARRRISEELKTHPYRSRFIDTTTASSWRECYQDKHPMTRSESRKWKMELLRVVSEEMKLVTGSETGHEAAVPYVHYFEGMLSLGPYRVPDAGRNMAQILDEVPERVAKFQVGHQYRLPLWELVYHDCVVAQWYWGDYNNKLPAIWGKRDLFNALYATPPMFMFTRKTWEANKDRFVKSYQDVCPVVRAAGYAEMLDHRFLTGDRRVQQTVFSNGMTVTVNFGDQPFQQDNAEPLAPGDFRVEGLPAE